MNPEIPKAVRNAIEKRKAEELEVLAGDNTPEEVEIEGSEIRNVITRGMESILSTEGIDIDAFEEKVLANKGRLKRFVALCEDAHLVDIPELYEVCVTRAKAGHKGFMELSLLLFSETYRSRVKEMKSAENAINFNLVTSQELMRVTEAVLGPQVIILDQKARAELGCTDGLFGQDCLPGGPRDGEVPTKTVEDVKWDSGE